MGRGLGASSVTQRHAAVAAAVLALGSCVVGGGCATGPATGANSSAGSSTDSSAIDVVDAAGRVGRVGAPGRVTVIDLCASWAAACNVNARVLDEVAQALDGQPVEVVTVLLDDGAMGRAALASYASTLGVTHPVLLAGPRVRAGASVLGAVGYVPRLVVVDARGRVRIDDSGGVVDVRFLVERVRELLRER